LKTVFAADAHLAKGQHLCGATAVEYNNNNGDDDDDYDDDDDDVLVFDVRPT
jgi:hypothetical protein